MTTFVPPYTVTVTSITGGKAECAYVDGNEEELPPDTVLTTTTPANTAGTLEIIYVEDTVSSEDLRLVGAAVKTVGNDSTMTADNYLSVTRTQNSKGAWLDTVIVPWAPNQFTTRGVVLLFAQVNSSGEMLNFYPTTDPQTQNDEA